MNSYFNQKPSGSGPIRRKYIPPTGMLYLIYILLGIIVGELLGLLVCKMQVQALNPQFYHYNNSLKFPYGVNFKYNGEIYQHLERVWVVKRFNIPTANDITAMPKLPNLPDCTLRNVKNKAKQSQTWIVHTLRTICNITVPSIKLLHKTANFYNRQIKQLLEQEIIHALYGMSPIGVVSYQKAEYQMMKRSAASLKHLIPAAPTSPAHVPLAVTIMGKLSSTVANAMIKRQLAQFEKMNNLNNTTPRKRRFLFGNIVKGIASFAGPLIMKGIGSLFNFAVESVSSHIHKKRNKALAHAMTKMNSEVEVTKNQMHQLNEDFLLYGDYNLNSTEEILKVLEHVDTRTSMLEQWLNGSTKTWVYAYLNHLSGITMYSHQLQVYTTMFKERYLRLQEALYEELKMILRSIAILSRGHLPSELISPSEITKLSQQAINMVKHSHPDYVLAFTHVTDYYDMPVVTFGRDDEDRLVVCFPIFLKEFNTQPLTLYQIETVKVPILDENYVANSYTEIQPNKPYIATNKDHYIQLVLPELRMCKHIRQTHFCEEIFLVKHKSKYSCESALFYDQPRTIINEFCEIKYFYNMTVMPSVLDGGTQIVLANFANQKNLLCSHNQDLAEPLPTGSYVLVNRTLLCYCHIQIGMTAIAKTITDCADSAFPVFYYTVNLGFWNAISELVNDTYNTPLELKTFESILPIALIDYAKYPDFQDFCLENKHSTQMAQPQTVKQLKQTIKTFQNFTKHRKKLSYDQGKETAIKIKIPVKSSFMYSVIAHIYFFLGSTLGIVFAIPHIYMAIKLRKASALLGVLASHPTPAKAMSLSPTKAICHFPGISLAISVISIICVTVYLYRNCKNLTWYKGYRFNNTCTLYLFFCTETHYVPLKIGQCSGTPYMLHYTNMISDEQVMFIRGSFLCGWDQIKINWQDCVVWLNTKQIRLKNLMYVPCKDKIRFRRLLRKKYSLMLMVKQYDSWYKLPNITGNKPQTETITEIPIPQIQPRSRPGTPSIETSLY